MCAYVPNYRYVKPSAIPKPTTKPAAPQKSSPQPKPIPAKQTEQEAFPNNPSPQTLLQKEQPPIHSNQIQGVNVSINNTQTSTAPAKQIPLQTPVPTEVKGYGASVEASCGKKVPPSAPPISEYYENVGNNDVLAKGDNVPPSYDELFGEGEEENVSVSFNFLETKNKKTKNPVLNFYVFYILYILLI